MFKNYIKIAFRNLWKDKTFTFLNIIGLSVAFGVAILLGMAAFFDLSYDRFHEKADLLYQVYHISQTPEDAEAGISQPVPFANALKAEVPGVTGITRYLNANALVIHKGKELALETAYVDNDFFSMFSFPIEKGKSKAPLEKKSSLVVTEKTAKMLFGEEEAVGKTVHILIDGRKEPFTVSAVLTDFVSQSSIYFDIALNFQNSPGYSENRNRWDNWNHEVYLQLQEGITSAQFEKSSRAFTALHYKNDIVDAKRDGAQPNNNGQYMQLRLLPFEDVHFTVFENGTANVSKAYPFLILGIGFLILFIASVNFINMSIAKSAQRLREIGMRKTLGAKKGQLFFQFWIESIFVFLSSVAVGILISNLLLDQFKMLFRTEASFGNVTTPLLLIGFLSSVLIITFIAGGYPALLLSKLGTLQALKGKLQVSGRNRVRDLLMVVQFGIAILLISGTFVLWSQLEYMRNKDLGFNKEQVVAFPLNGKKDNGLALQLLRNELQDEPGIISVTASDDILGLGKDGSISTLILGFDYKGHGVKTNMLVVGHDYVETLGMELVSGRTFSRQYATDSLSIVINEAMAKELNEAEPLNKQIILDSINYTIIGVLENYNFQDLNKEIEPITLFMSEGENLYYAYVKVAPQNLSRSFDRIKSVWNEIEPNAEFLGSFLDENIDRTLRKERTMTTMISSGSILAIILSCIGLFAISLLVVSQRQKEIGIRKVVGASVSTITVLLTKDFLKLVGIAFLIATPIAWYVTSQWLQNYVYRIHLTIWIFLAAGAIALVIAVLTISVRTVRAALQNPVKSLRTE